MHLHRLKISAFRNLRDFEVAFDATDATTGKRFDSHAVIGQNGSGKSNLLEAIATLFRDLDLNEPASLDYELDYAVRGHRIKVRAQRGKTPKVLIDGVPSSARKLAEHGREYLSIRIDHYLDAIKKAASGANPGAKRDARRYADEIREMTREQAELSSVAKWCVLFRNDPRVAKLAI
ncbi:MAG: hypothetical protein A3H93_11400 [Rhodocyclales bacterium RIFCSPLOWO2_02_FULL_63_24]|nr:MAG: hypothetical protein A3H93_11400 [Rhodocyclales bacterium RIFCSPLOWO2_02_FULL_63_24]